MNLKTYFKGKENIFTKITSAGGITELLGKEAGLFSLLLTGYGERVVFEPYRSMSVNELASLINLELAGIWQEKIALQVNGVLGGTKRTIAETITNDETRTLARESVDKISAFNDSNLIEDGGNDTEETDVLGGEKERTLTETFYNPNNALDLLPNLDKVNIIRAIVQDVAKFLTLSIY